jgi:hypothetical protein
MPGGDRTGPLGMGPMTGRAAGFCAGYPVPGYMNPARGRGGWPFGGWGWFGRGRGRPVDQRFGRAAKFIMHDSVTKDLQVVDKSQGVEVALAAVRRSISFCRQLNMPALGVVENMSGFVCSKCGQRTEIFASGGGERLAREMRRREMEDRAKWRAPCA